MKIAALTLISVLAVPCFAGTWFDEDSCRYTAPRRAVTPAAGITKVFIHAEAGSLTVEGRPSVTQIAVDGTACASDEEYLRKMMLTLRKSGSELHIDVDLPDRNVVFGYFSAHLDFTVIVPAGIPVAIEDGSGWMKVSNTGETSIDDGSGSIEIRNVSGPLSIRDGSGEMEVDTVGGNVTVDDGSGEMTLSGIRGNVEIRDGSGSIDVQRVDGSLLVREDGSGSIVAENVKHDVTVEDDGSGSLSVSDIGGNFTVHHKGSGSIDNVRVAGRVSVPSRH